MNKTTLEKHTMEKTALEGEHLMSKHQDRPQGKATIIGTPDYKKIAESFISIYTRYGATIKK